MHESALTSIRRPVLRGRQRIEGLWFAAERFAEPVRQQMILAHWHSGASAYRFAEGDLLCFGLSQSVMCEQIDGWPLIRQGRVLYSAVLEPGELAGLPAADVWLVRGSQAVALQLRDAQKLEPGLWLDVSAYPVLDTFDCVVALPAPVLEPLSVDTDVRHILGNAVAAPDPERAAVMQALIERQRQRQVEPPASPASQPSSGFAGVAPGTRIGGVSAFWEKIVLSGLGLAVLISLVRSAQKNQGRDLPGVATFETLKTVDNLDGWVFGLVISAVLFTAILALVGRLLWRNGQQWSATAVNRVTAASPASGINQRTRPDRSRPAAWRRWLTRLTLGSRLQALYGRRQAAYMRRMLDMFENGDMEEALRHAIPLGSERGFSEQSFGTPQRRQELKLSGAKGPSRSMLFPDDMEAHLRQLYRQSFTRLDREGRIEEAVFVLAELLDARQEALDYLERHARFKQAADLALAWDMSAALIVRLLCLAGDWQRALQVARRDDAFSDAVMMLQNKWPEIADKLRLEWAEALTRKGLWLNAVEVIWSLPAERERAAQWLLDAEAAGGRLAAAALVKRAILLPDTLSAYSAYLQQLRDDPQRVGERAALAQALLQHKNHGGLLTWLAGAIVHAVLADEALGIGQLESNQLLPLVKLSNDKLLRNDLPQNLSSSRKDMALHNTFPSRQWYAADTGSRQIFDAVPLDDRRYLLALGEAGAAVIDEHGKTLFNLAAPAWHIVLAHSRQVALVLARRDAVWRVSKLDLVRRKVTDLGVLVTEHFARDFDGSAWTIGADNQIRVVDVDRAFETLWHVSDLPGRLMSLQSDVHNEFLWLGDWQSGTQLWHYQLPGRRLLSRNPVPELTEEQRFRILTSAGEVLQCWIQGVEVGEPALVLEGAGRDRVLPLPGLSDGLSHAPQIFATDKWIVVGYFTDDGDLHWCFFSRADDRLAARLSWPQPRAVGLRRIGPDWVLFDRQGRLVHVNVNDSQLRNLTVH